MSFPTPERSPVAVPTPSQETLSAQKTLSDLRDHLARHDKPIAFFFGAGTSCAVRVPVAGDEGKMQSLIPAVAALTKICNRCGVPSWRLYQVTGTVLKHEPKFKICKNCRTYCKGATGQ